jgi:hypothetical protein
MESKAALNNVIMDNKKVVQQTVFLILVSPAVELLVLFRIVWSNVVIVF